MDIKTHPSQAELHELYHYDPDTGIFTRKTTRRRWKAGQIAGTLSDGYIQLNVNKSLYRAHRLAFIYMTGAQPDTAIDHINGDRSDNRWSNLRAATTQQNLHNHTHSKRNKLGLKGVYKPYPSSKKWVARITHNRTYMYLGVFETPELAKAAYDAAAKVLHGEFFRS